MLAAVDERTPHQEELPAVDKRCLSVDETATAVGLGRTKIYELINEGKLKSVKVGRRRLVPAAAVDEFLETLG
jgi:excisionase family DNA binding protein